MDDEPPVPDQLIAAPIPDALIEEITRVLDRDRAYATGGDVYAHVFASPLFFPLQRKREMAQMLQIARGHVAGRAARVIMEIGACYAGGVYHWCKSLSPTHLIACEIRGTPYAEAFERAFPGIAFLWLEESSYDTPAAENVRTWLDGNQIDILFLDGDKEHFLDDFTMYRPLMRPGGVIFMHDIQVPAPRNAFEVASTSPGIAEAFTIIDTSECTEATARDVAGVPLIDAYDHWLRYWNPPTDRRLNRCQSCGVGVLRLK